MVRNRSRSPTQPDGNGSSLDGAARELLRATYLRPLRDAEAELRSGRGSRLSQILAGYSAMKGQGIDDYDPEGDAAPSTLVGILRRAEHDIRCNDAVSDVSQDVNSAYLQRFAIGDDVLRAKISVATAATLARALERLELNLFAESDEWTRRLRQPVPYSRVFQRSGEQIPVPVACIRRRPKRRVTPPVRRAGQVAAEITAGAVGSRQVW